MSHWAHAPSVAAAGRGDTTRALSCAATRCLGIGGSGRILWREEADEMSKIPMIRDDLREGSGGTRLIGSVLLVELC